jgi:hypothetical protein
MHARRPPPLPGVMQLAPLPCAGLAGWWAGWRAEWMTGCGLRLSPLALPALRPPQPQQRHRQPHSALRPWSTGRGDIGPRLCSPPRCSELLGRRSGRRLRQTLRQTAVTPGCACFVRGYTRRRINMSWSRHVIHCLQLTRASGRCAVKHRPSQGAASEIFSQCHAMPCAYSNTYYAASAVPQYCAVPPTTVIARRTFAYLPRRARRVWRVAAMTCQYASCVTFPPFCCRRRTCS